MLNHNLDVKLSQAEEEFFQKSEKFLEPGKWKHFLLTWVHALKAYGTPADFVEAAEHELTSLTFSEQLAPFVYVTSSNYEQRAALMANQVPYEAKQALADYGLRLDFDDCFLCQNVIQAVDAATHPDVQNNLIADLGIHYILPNRYPAQPGHSLSVPIDHDDVTDRVPPQREGSSTMYLLQPGKTRGNVISADYLDAVMQDCDTYHLVAIRNHVLDGMSIPGHDHFHLMPEDLPSVSIFDEILADKAQTAHGGSIYTPQNTPFDALVVTSSGTATLSQIACLVLERMERDDQVFTLAYHNNHLLISPRLKVDRRIQVGGGVAIHYLDTKGEEFLGRLNTFVPMKGTYDWARYV